MKDDGKPIIPLNSSQQEALNEFNQNEWSYEQYDCDCGAHYDELITIAEKDRYGLHVETKICPKCGLVMTNPRMTQKSYDKFYDTIYRKLYLGKKQGTEEYYIPQLMRGKNIYDYLQQHEIKMNNGGGYS